MSWQGWRDFVTMGDYGPYVWGAYGVLLALIAVECGLVRLRWRSILGYLGSVARRPHTAEKEA